MSSSLITPRRQQSLGVELVPSRSILLVTHRVPFPPDKGDRIRTFNLIRFLARDHRVFLASLADEPIDSEALRNLKEWCEEIVICPLGGIRWIRAAATSLLGRSATCGAFFSRKLIRILKEWQEKIRFDVAIASSSGVADYLEPLAHGGVPCVIDFMDVDSQKWLDYARRARIPKQWLYAWEGRSLRHQEKKIGNWASKILVVSEAEKTLLLSFANHAPVEAVTNGVDLDYFVASPLDEANQDCVFIGALDYFPNVAGLHWFTGEIWPAVRKRMPKARLRIVGRSPTDDVKRMGQIDGVEVIGTVPDVRPHVHASRVVIAPLQIARGVQNKVLEGMAMGRPVVASPPACAGLRGQIRAPVLRSETPEEWKTNLINLLGDIHWATELGQAGRTYVQAWHSWDACLAPLNIYMDESINRPKDSRQGCSLIV